MAWLAALLPRRKRRAELRDAAVRYARLGWLVVPGAFVTDDSPPHARHARHARRTGGRAAGSVPARCSCGNQRCPAPGEHPAAPDWQVQATLDPRVVASWWSGREIPNVLLPTGWTFDVLLVPRSLGARLLARFRESGGLTPGPVARGADGQWWFFTAPAVEADRPHARWLATVGVTHLGAGGYTLVPPSTGGLSGGIGWVLAPDQQDGPEGPQGPQGQGQQDGQDRPMPSVEVCARLLATVVAPRHGATAPRPPAIEGQPPGWRPLPPGRAGDGGDGVRR